MLEWNQAARMAGRMAIRRVAELAGVSIATVSRVINGHADVSSQTREAVHRVIGEHGYTASSRSRAGRTGQIGVMVPLIHPGCFARSWPGFVRELCRAG
jgi:DNA-binding LacI/PurR family transcriptional regulator